MGEFFSYHSWQIIAQLALLVCSGFMSASETAYFSLSRRQLASLRNGGASARLAAALAAQPQRLLNTLLLGNMVVNTAYASISAVAILGMQESGLLPTWAAGAASVGTLLVLILAGEVAPKMLALSASARLATAAAGPLAALERLLAGPLWVSQTVIVSPLTRLIAPLRPPKGDITSQELRAILDLSARRGALHHDANLLLQEILALTDLRVRDIMTPRVDMVAFDLSRPMAELQELFRTSRLRRIVVYEGDIDNVLGAVQARHVFPAPAKPLRDLVCPVPFVPLPANLERTLLQFRVMKAPLAVVVDEYGGTAGMVALENILEQIIGDIPDRRDGVRSQAVERVSEREYLVDGDLPVHEWAEAFKIRLASRRITTVGGLVVSLIGHIPRVGEEARFRNMVFTVELMRGRRIGRLRLRLEGTAP